MREPMRPGRCRCCGGVAFVAVRDGWCGPCMEEASWEPPCEPCEVIYPMEGW